MFNYSVVLFIRSFLDINVAVIYMANSIVYACIFSLSTLYMQSIKSCGSRYLMLNYLVVLFMKSFIDVNVAFICMAISIAYGFIYSLSTF